MQNQCDKSRPHPGPLPRGEGERCGLLVEILDRGCRRRCLVKLGKMRHHPGALATTNAWQMVLPLLGERVGVRADVITNLLRLYGRA